MGQFGFHLRVHATNTLIQVHGAAVNVRLAGLEVRESNNQRPIRVSASPGNTTSIVVLHVVGCVLVHVSAQRLERNTLTLIQRGFRLVDVDFQPRTVHLRDTQRRPVRAHRIRGHTQTGCGQLGSSIVSLFQRAPRAVSQHLSAHAGRADSSAHVRTATLTRKTKAHARARSDALSVRGDRNARRHRPLAHLVHKPGRP